jgi:ecotin
MKKLILASLLSSMAIWAGCASLPSETDPANEYEAHASRYAELKAFPMARDGYQRHVIQLPRLEDESLHSVTLELGKTVLTDSVNRYMMMGSVQSNTVEGWGYTYYTLESNGEMAGTLMAVSPVAPKVERFVTVNAPMPAIRYNSKLPIVVIVPDGFEVKYRIWNAGKLQVAPQG